MFVFLCTLVLVACEQEEIWSNLQDVDNVDQTIVTRGTSDIPLAISQLSGIPVNIKSAANGKYLSAESEGRSLYLSPSDDGSLRQRWNIEVGAGDLYNTHLTLIGGNKTFANGKVMVEHKGDYYYPVLTSSFVTNIEFFLLEDQISYIIKAPGLFSNYPFYIPGVNCCYLQPKNTSSAEIIGDDYKYKGELIKWYVIPVDEFRVEEITYDLTTNDQLTVIPTQIANKTLVNDTDLPATRVISFQETITNESSFSETEGVKVTVSTSTSAKVGIAGFFEGSFSGEVSNEKSWNYTVGGKETKSYTISESITQEVPPRTTIKAELIATKYDADLTYIAKMYGINTGKTIYLKGKWKGAVVQESKIVLTQENKVLKTIKVTPE